MSVWFVSVWASVTCLSSYADARLAIATVYVHHQSSCLSLYFQALSHVSSFNATSAWFSESECSHAQSEFIADVSDLLLMSWLSLFSERSDCHCISCIFFHNSLDSLLLRLQDVLLSWSISSVLRDEWWLRSIFSVFYLAFSWLSSWLLWCCLCCCYHSSKLFVLMWMCQNCVSLLTFSCLWL